MRIGLAQINSHIGAFEKNKASILNYIKQAKDKSCDLVVFPEMSLFGYWPNDLLERPSVVKAQTKTLNTLSTQLPKGIAALVGFVSFNQTQGKKYKNSVALLQKDKKPQIFSKELLPTYDVFDELRHIEKDDLKKNILKFKNKNILITICEDIWSWEKVGTDYAENPLKKLKGKKIDLVVNLSASPFSKNKHKRREKVTQYTSKLFNSPIVYVNMVGAQDEIIYDGSGFVLDEKGKKQIQCLRFKEDLQVYNFETHVNKRKQPTVKKTPFPIDGQSLREALILGIKDFVTKTGFTRVHLGLSGGVDSALVACLAVDALGAKAVKAVALPGPYSNPQSLKLAKALSKNLGIKCTTYKITDIYKKTNKDLEKFFGSKPLGRVNENLQARLRALILMAISNQENSLLLATGNKSEFATGYATLYGDMCGGLAPIGDLLKKEVYELCEIYNKENELIPSDIISRPPTAELQPHQKDTDSLPPYHELDPSIEKLVVKCSPAYSSIDKWTLKAMYQSEFKRWQAPPILRVSDRSFGHGRRYPITHQIQC